LKFISTNVKFIDYSSFPLRAAIIQYRNWVNCFGRGIEHVDIASCAEKDLLLEAIKGVVSERINHAGI